MEKVDRLQKEVVKAILRDSDNRGKKKKAGTMTLFDVKADEAVEYAKEKLRLPADSESARKLMLSKICESLECAKPWERMGETYLGRWAFYEYRLKFIRLVAQKLDMTTLANERA
ncbi:MAG: hypothetical protein Q4A32_00910 [Lachnospiraceae bacterium]|nr:hypothetical protein [Lachnospiraceae bacterium]